MGTLAVEGRLTPVDDPGADAVAPYQGRALDDMPNCVFVLGPRGRIVYANHAACDAMGIGPYVGKSFADYFMVFPNSANDAFYEAVLDTIRDKQARHQGRYLYVAPDGRRYAFFVTSSYLEGPDGSFLVVTCTDVTAEETAERLRREATFLLVSSIVYICAYLFVYAAWVRYGHPFDRSGLSRVMEAGGVLLGFLALRFTSLGPRDLGLGTEALGRNLAVDGAACLVAVGAMALLKLVLMRVAPAAIAHPEAFFAWGWVGWRRLTTYAFTALIQEFLTRGIMYLSLRHVLRGRRGHVVAIVVSTLMFSSMQLAYGLSYMLGMAVLLGVLGVVYERQESIWGITLIHFAIGASAMLFGLI